MAYDDTSFNGDLIVDEYDDHNNFIGTNTPMGYYAYHILGDGFDLMAEQCSQFLNDFSILSANASSLDKFWGISYNMHRPKLYVGTENERLLTDDEYRVYLYLRNCRLMTREDLLVNFGKCFGLDDYPIVFSNEAFYLEASDHLNYEAEETTSSNLHKRDDDTTLHFVTNFSNDETTEVIESGLSVAGETITVINIPFQNWDNDFLEYMEQYISIKGNIKIKEYTL